MPHAERIARTVLLFLCAPEISGLTEVLHVWAKPEVADEAEAEEGRDQIGFKRRHGTAKVKFFGEEMEKRDEPTNALQREEAFEERLRDRAGIVGIRGGFAKKRVKFVRENTRENSKSKKDG